MQSSLLFKYMNCKLAWGTTKYIGCGVQNCDTQTIVVCNYSPTGNMRDQLIYDVGTPCSKCPSGTECAADEGLCIFP
ncbi:hypothetical protein OESDEN_01917 [Oesophagostomum dentatum]|uniref:SCP domain-containing protein n=1 Tax=Oesophagostomum dentatum TaxID=61180 RepID=A0A0B1TQM2_OESDE|nr:hypothetical protein OESDEN_01917 [Oesophagostomum dentatum]